MSVVNVDVEAQVTVPALHVTVLQRWERTLQLVPPGCRPARPAAAAIQSSKESSRELRFCPGGSLVLEIWKDLEARIKGLIGALEGTEVWREGTSSSTLP